MKHSMKFFVVTYSDQSMPEGIGYEFTRTKRQARRIRGHKIGAIKADMRAYVKEAEDEIEARARKAMAGADVAMIEIQEVVVNGTDVRSLVFDALCYQVVS